jgi:hypothetical protein
MWTLSEALERLAELLGLRNKPVGARVPVKATPGPVVRRRPPPRA